MSRSLRFAAGFLIGASVGFIAANTIGRQDDAAPVAAVAPAPAAEATEELPAPSVELSDAEIAKAREAVDSRPDDFQAQFNMGEALLRIARKPGDAIAYYERAVALAPRDAAALVGLGDASFAAAIDAQRAGRHEETLFASASKAYERALAVEPKNATARAALGYTYALRQPPDYARAIAEFERALETDPANELAREGLTAARAEQASEQNPTP